MWPNCLTSNESARRRYPLQTCGEAAILTMTTETMKICRGADRMTRATIPPPAHQTNVSRAVDRVRHDRDK